jgi:hypothetical protein
LFIEPAVCTRGERPRRALIDIEPVNGGDATNVRRRGEIALRVATVPFSVVFIDAERRSGSESMRKRTVVCN